MFGFVIIATLLSSLQFQKESHGLGYSTAVRCIAEINTFSRIKNATVLAALRTIPRSTSTTTGTAKGSAGATSVKIIEGAVHFY